MKEIKAESETIFKVAKGDQSHKQGKIGPGELLSAVEIGRKLPNRLFK